jgi:hypothetical protein
VPETRLTHADLLLLGRRNPSMLPDGAIPGSLAELLAAFRP